MLEQAADLVLPTDCEAIGRLEHRQRARMAGKVYSLRVQPWAAGVTALECVLTDGTGQILVVFVGRRDVPGIKAGTRLVIEGTVADHHGRLAVLNPMYEILADETAPEAGVTH